MINNKNVYLTITLVGLVFTILGYVTQGEKTALTTLYLVLVLLVSLKLIEEYRYYRRYNAPVASAIFLGLPGISAITGSIVSRFASIDGNPFLQEKFLSLNLEFLHIYIFQDSFSFIFTTPFYSILLLLFYRFYIGQYPRVFLFRRKLFKQFVLYFNVVLIIMLVILWQQSGTILFIELIFSLLSVLFIIQTYILKVILIPVRIVPRPRRLRFSQRSRPRISHVYRRNETPSQLFSANPIPVGTLPSGSNTDRTSSLSSTVSTAVPNPVMSVRSIHRPINLLNNRTNSTVQSNNRSKATKRYLKASLRKFLPVTQNLAIDDFKCIFCYEIPTAKDTILICRYCKKPAHKKELLQWSVVSTICSYCNKAIDSGNKPISVSGLFYTRLIKLALRKRKVIP